MSIAAQAYKAAMTLRALVGIGWKQLVRVSSHSLGWPRICMAPRLA